MPGKHGLGRGLGALIKDTTSRHEDSDSGPFMVSTGRIKKNTLQPRKKFEEEALLELTESIKTKGVLQPLLVRPSGKKYELIAGERRFRAAKAAGLTDVPVIVVDVDDNESLEIALIENLQREDLGILEEAEGYQALADKFDMTQEQIAGRVGKARATVTNAMRLLMLPDEIKTMLSSGDLSAGHAKVLIGLEIPDEQILLARRCAAENLSVRNLERLAKKIKQAPRKPRSVRADIPTNHLTYLSDKLHSHFGTSIRINPSRTFANGKKGKGKIEIDFYSNEDLDRILHLLGVGD
ncbi:MAG: ParB/RepB/Spo0J family partition protein [Kiritimatiellae bacterium]|nr:ParB/RepB/Spo0J family partition protein [Kiritimatiellia bacterium]